MSRIIEDDKRRFKEQLPAVREPVPFDLSIKSKVFSSNQGKFRTIDTYDVGATLKLIGYSDECDRELKEIADKCEVSRLTNVPYSQVKAAIFYSMKHGTKKLVARSFPFVPKLVVTPDELDTVLENAETVREWKEGLVFMVYWIYIVGEGERMMISTGRRCDVTNSFWFQSPKMHEMLKQTGVDLNSLDHRYCHVLLLQHPCLLTQSQEELEKPRVWLLQSWKTINYNGDILRTLERSEYVHGKIPRIPILTKAEAKEMWNKNIPIITRKGNSWRVFMSIELQKRYKIASENRDTFYRYFTLGEERFNLRGVAPACRNIDFDEYEKRYQEALSTLKTVLHAQVLGKMIPHTKHMVFIEEVRSFFDDCTTVDKEEIDTKIEECLKLVSPAYIYSMACSGDVRGYLQYQNRKPLTLGDFVPNSAKTTPNTEENNDGEKEGNMDKDKSDKE